MENARSVHFCAAVCSVHCAVFTVSHSSIKRALQDAVRECVRHTQGQPMFVCCRRWGALFGPSKVGQNLGQLSPNARFLPPDKTQ